MEPQEEIGSAFPTGIKDLDILFLSGIENDRDLLNTLNTNRATKKYSNNESLWINRFKRKYPEDFDYVKDHKNMSWKDFSLLLIKYLDLVKGNYNTAMKLVAQGGHQDLVDFFISEGADNWDWGMQVAARGGHQELVDFFISKGARDWNMGMRGAAQGGHRDLVDFFISKGARYWNSGMEGAEQGGHHDLVDFFKRKMQTRQ